MIEIRLYIHEFVMVGSYNRVKLRVTISYERSKKSRLNMVVTYYHVRQVFFRLYHENDLIGLVGFAVNS